MAADIFTVVWRMRLLLVRADAGKRFGTIVMMLRTELNWTAAVDSIVETPVDELLQLMLLPMKSDMSRAICAAAAAELNWTELNSTELDWTDWWHGCLPACRWCCCCNCCCWWKSHFAFIHMYIQTNIQRPNSLKKYVDYGPIHDKMFSSIVMNNWRFWRPKTPLS